MNSREDLPLGRLFMLGFRGAELDEGHWIATALGRDRLGGVLLFDRNIDGSVQNIVSPKQLRRLIQQLRAWAIEPLLVAIDQEGGLVCRLKQRDGFAAAMPSAAALGLRDPAATSVAATGSAAMLAELGINLNFAPVVDLNLNPNNPIIGRYQRSFGANPTQVAAHARAYIEAHHAAGVRCCLKHFPGHGSAAGDSHLGYVDISQCWCEQELEPYQRLFAEGYDDGVMTAHLVLRRYENTGLPATLSSAIVHDLLRRQLGFRGVVFSDDLQMQAISACLSFTQAVQAAFMAGVDMLVIGNNLADQPETLGQGIAAIKELLDTKRITRERILASLGRIARLNTAPIQ